MIVYKCIYTAMYILGNRLFIIRTTPPRALIYDTTVCFKTVKEHDTNNATLLCTLLLWAGHEGSAHLLGISRG